MDKDYLIRFAYDTDLKRPGCVLLQATLGGDSSLCQTLFDTQDWLLAPTPGLKLYGLSLADWKRVADVTKAHRKS